MNLDLRNRRTLVESLPKDFKIGVEVGTRTGWFAKYIVDHTNMTLYCVDPWEINPQLGNPEDSYKMFKFLTHSYKDRIIEVKDWSPKAAERFEDNSLDFIYIDAEHTYEAVKLDIPAWWSKLKKGGIMAGHDYSDNWPGVKKAVNEFVSEYNSYMITRPVQLLITGIVNNSFQSWNGDLDEFDGGENSWVIIKK